MTEPRPRHQSLDVIRGFALLGILPVNAAFFAAPWQTAVNPMLAPLAVDAAAPWPWFWMHVLFEYKCITLFSMLFGASLYLVGGEREDAARGVHLRRRLAWLAVFGLIHGVLIWYGDILFIYALTGALILFARSWSAAALARMGLVLFALSLLMSALFALVYDDIPAAALLEMQRAVWAPAPDAVAATIGAYRGGFFPGVAENAGTWAMFMLNGLPSIVVRTAAMMMFGMALLKTGVLTGAHSARLYAFVAALGAAALGLIAWQGLANAEAGFSFEHMQRRGGFANVALSPLVSLGYASIFILILKSGALRMATDALASVGRMAFSNYIAQSLLMTSLMWGGARGLGLYGHVTRTDLWLIVASIWIAQVIWSPLWLRQFRTGPLEWVWRRLTYSRPTAVR